MTADIPRRISERWLVQQTNKLSYTLEVVDGSPNPNHAKLSAEIQEAEAEFGRRKAFESWAKSSFGMAPNAYPLRVGGQTYEPGTVFLKKDQAGKITFRTVEKAWRKYEATTQPPV